jgi:hypothetical protein
MSSESSLIGKWSDSPCSKKNIAVCQKNPTISLSMLHKMFLETKKELEDTRIKFNNYLNNLMSNKWMNYKLFGDIDGKRKAFFIPSNDNFGEKGWDEAVKLCSDFNATLVEIDTSEKEFIFLSYLGQLGSQSNNLNDLWLKFWSQGFFWKVEMD